MFVNFHILILVVNVVKFGGQLLVNRMTFANRNENTNDS